MMMSELGSPAAVSAFLMSGWSNSTYRVELTVSGMIAATLPLPDLAKLFSSFMAEKLLVNDFVVNVGVEAPLDPAAEIVSPVAAMAPTAVRLANRPNRPNFFVRMCHPNPGPGARLNSLPDGPQRAGLCWT